MNTHMVNPWNTYKVYDGDLELLKNKNHDVWEPEPEIPAHGVVQYQFCSCNCNFSVLSIPRALFLFHQFIDLVSEAELRNWRLQERVRLAVCELPLPFCTVHTQPAAAPDAAAGTACLCLRRWHSTGCIAVCKSRCDMTWWGLAGAVLMPDPFRIPRCSS